MPMIFRKLACLLLIVGSAAAVAQTRAKTNANVNPRSGLQPTALALRRSRRTQKSRSSSRIPAAVSITCTAQKVEGWVMSKYVTASTNGVHAANAVVSLALCESPPTLRQNHTPSVSRQPAEFTISRPARLTGVLQPTRHTAS